MSIDRSTPVTINILTVIDTDYVKAQYPDPSQDSDNPTVIAQDSQYMVCADPRGIVSGQGTADLNFRAAPRDHVSFRGISIYGNSDDAVMIYAVKHESGNRVFSAFDTKVIEILQAVVPNVSTQDGLPASTVAEDFISYASTIVKSGVENFNVYFALYTLDDEGETQNLYGYYCCSSSITVKRQHRDTV